MTKKSSDNMPDPAPKVDMPKCGDTYKCEPCGMELEITTDCACADPDPACQPCFKCCGQEMCKE